MIPVRFEIHWSPNGDVWFNEDHRDIGYLCTNDLNEAWFMVEPIRYRSVLWHYRIYDVVENRVVQHFLPIGYRQDKRGLVHCWKKEGF